MQYHGKLYGKIAGMYFDTGSTSDDFDQMQLKLKEQEEKLRFISVTAQPPEQHQLVIAKYSEDTYAVARFENGSFLTAYPVYTQPLEYRPLF